MITITRIIFTIWMLTPLIQGQDATLDLVIAADNGTPSKVFFNDGLGNYQLEQELTTERFFSVAVDDLNGDGSPDLFLAACCGIPSQVWFNDGEGNFTNSGQALQNGLGDSWQVALGDLDGDGDVDAFIAENSNFFTGMGFSNHVLLNDGTGFFSDSGQSLGQRFTHGVALGDLDGDGDLDAVAANINCDPTTVWLNNGLAQFVENGQNLGTAGAGCVALGDLDGDGDLDMALGKNWCASNNQPGTRILFNDGSAIFSESDTRYGQFDSESLALGDVDGDGDLDMVTANQELSTGAGAPDQLWLNQGDGTFIDSGQTFGNGRSMGTTFGDIDGDGDLDLVIVGVSGTGGIWLNNGSGLYTDSGYSFGNLTLLQPVLVSLRTTCTKPLAEAGEDQTLCGNQTNLAASDAEQGIWEIVSGEGGQLDQATDPNTLFTGQAGETYQLRWVVGNETCNASDEVRITFAEGLGNFLPSWGEHLSVIHLIDYLDGGCASPRGKTLR